MKELTQFGRGVLQLQIWIFSRSQGGCSTQIKPATRGFTPGVKAETEKIFSICPKLLINGELYGLVLASRLKTG
jgi:hypothetical protein